MLHLGDGPAFVALCWHALLSNLRLHLPLLWQAPGLPPVAASAGLGVLTRLNQFSHNPFPLPFLPHEVSELMCTHVPVTRLMPITDSERMKKKKKRKKE